MTLVDADETFLNELRQRLSPRIFRDVTPHYLSEPRGRWQGQAGAILAPESVEEVSQIVTLAARERVGIVPYAGGTGLVGGQVKPDGPIPLILSLERMKAVRAIYPEENVVIAEAGVILSDLHDVAKEANRLFPLSIAAKGSARLGGLLATNAGGVNVLRYGNARDLCLGLEVVMPNGEIWHGLRRLRKDNMGYDLRDLLIGSEGTLGIITAATLKLVARPAIDGTALMTVPNPAAALSLLALAQARIGDGISAFELIHRQGLEFLSETLPDIRQPFEEKPEWFVLIDLGFGPGRDPAAALEDLFVAGLDAGLVGDGLIAQNETQRQAFWDIREHIPEANRHIGSISSHDVSLPLSEISYFVVEATKRLNSLGDMRINCFGHLGDGNLHYNVFPARGRKREEYAKHRAEIQEIVHALVSELGGSASAEHGIGRLKTADLSRYGDPVSLEFQRRIKSAFDPAGIMNPGVIFDEFEG